MTDELKAERADLVRKLNARDGTPGYSQNVRAIKDRIAAIDSQLAEPAPDPEPNE